MVKKETTTKTEKKHLPHSMLDTEFCRTKTCVCKGNNLEKQKTSFLNRPPFNTCLLLYFPFYSAYARIFHNTPILKIHHFPGNKIWTGLLDGDLYASIFQHVISVLLARAEVHFCFIKAGQDNLSLVPLLRGNEAHSPVPSSTLHCSPKGLVREHFHHSFELQAFEPSCVTGRA